MPSKRNNSTKSKSINNSTRENRAHPHSQLKHSAIKRNNEKAVNNPVPGDKGKK